jgi:pyruvate/2-oxoglutarate/acetoin dehydrogenase E1 component
MSTATEPVLARYGPAIKEAVAEEMRRDDRVMIMGIDIGASGGIFTVTRGLFEEFGRDRVRDTPISEMAFVGAAVGAAATGLRPVVEIMFMDFLGVCFDPLLNQASKLRYMTGGLLAFPVVFRTQTGAGRSSGAQHSQSLEAIVAHIPGIKVVMPSNAGDAYALMRLAIQDDNPVVYVENRLLYGRKGELPNDDDFLPIGKARTVRQGSDVTVVAWSRMVEVAIEAAGDLTDEGVDVEVVDLRSLVPMDIDTVIDSVSRTGRVVVVHEAVTDFGAGAEVVARIVELAFDSLDAPPARVGAPAVPLPFSPALEKECIPDAGKVAVAVRQTLRSV